MKWLLMWLNVSVATLNATLQLLVIYRLIGRKSNIDDIKRKSTTNYPNCTGKTKEYPR